MNYNLNLTIRLTCLLSALLLIRFQCNRKQMTGSMAAVCELSLGGAVRTGGLLCCVMQCDASSWCLRLGLTMHVS